MTAVMVVLLAMPLTTPLLVIAGVLSGAGSGLVMTPVLIELSRRSGDADRGSAFSLFSAALAVALVVGSIGGAPLVAAFGFEVAILATLGGIAGAAALTLWDRGLRAQPVRGAVSLSRRVVTAARFGSRRSMIAIEREMIQARETGEIDLLRHWFLAGPAQQVALAGRDPKVADDRQLLGGFDPLGHDEAFQSRRLPGSRAGCVRRIVGLPACTSDGRSSTTSNCICAEEPETRVSGPDIIGGEPKPADRSALTLRRSSSRSSTSSRSVSSRTIRSSAIACRRKMPFTSLGRKSDDPRVRGERFTLR